MHVLRESHSSPGSLSVLSLVPQKPPAESGLPSHRPGPNRAAGAWKQLPLHAHSLLSCPALPSYSVPGPPNLLSAPSSPSPFSLRAFAGLVLWPGHSSSGRLLLITSSGNPSLIPEPKVAPSPTASTALIYQNLKLECLYLLLPV